MKDITYQTGFSFGRLGHTQGGTWRYRWCWGGGGLFFYEIQPDLVCELLTLMAHAPAQCLGFLPPGALERGQKNIFLDMVIWNIKLKGMSRIH